MVLIIGSAFNTSFIFFPHKCFLWQHYLQKEASKKTVQTMLTQLHAFQALTLQQDCSFSSSSFVALSFSLTWHNSQSGTSSLCRRFGVRRTCPHHAPSSHATRKPGPPPPWQGLGAFLLRGLAAARGPASCGAARRVRNLALAFRNLVKLGTETLDHLLLF